MVELVDTADLKSAGTLIRSVPVRFRSAGPLFKLVWGVFTKRVRKLLSPKLLNHCQRFVLILWSVCFFSHPALALPFVQEWEKVAGVEHYDYQVSTGPQFLESEILKSSSLDENRLELNLKAGVYYFRLRSAGAAKGAVGEWSHPVQIKLVEESLQILSPKNDEKVPLLSQASELRVEWTRSSSDVEDYQLRLEGPSHQVVYVQSKVNEVTVPRLAPGKWRLQLFARRKTQVIFSSPPIEVELQAKEAFAPRIVYPIDSDVLYEFAEFDLKWIKKIAAKKSEIILARADQPGFPVVFREGIENASGSFVMQGMPVGLYQMSIRDYDERGEEFAESTVTLRVIPNIHDLQPENINITSRFVIGPFLGSRTISTPSMQDVGVSSQSSMLRGVQAEGKASWRFLPSQTIEGALAAGSVSQNLAAAAGQVEDFKGPTDGYFRLGYGRKVFARRSTLEGWLKYFVEYQYWRAPVNDSPLTTVAPLYTMQNFGSFGFGLGAELKYRVKPHTHWEVNAYLPLPFLADKGTPSPNNGTQLGTGKWAEFYYPRLEVLAVLRHKISREFWVCLGAKTVLGFTSVREDVPSTRTLITEWSVSPRIGLDWDL